MIKYLGEEFDDYGNPIPVKPVAYEPIPERPAVGGETIPVAASRARAISDEGRVPYITNIPGTPSDPRINPKDVVTIEPSQMQIPPRPDDRGVALANEIVKFRKHIVDNLYGGVDLGQSMSASPIQREEFNNTMRLYTDMFTKDLVERDRIQREQARGETQLRMKYDSGDRPYKEWDEAEKATAFQNRILNNETPKFSNRDSEARRMFEQDFNSYLNSTGLSANDITSIRSEVSSLKKSVDNQQKSRDMMNGFIKNIDKQVDKITDLMSGDDIKRLGIRTADQGIRTLKTKLMGSGAERVLESYLREISTEIAKVTTGSQASIAEVSVEAQKVWSEIHDKNLSFPELIKVLEATKQQGGLRLQSADEALLETRNQQAAILNKYLNKKTTPSPKESTSVNAPPIALLKEGKATRFKNGQAWTLKNGKPVQVK